MDSFQQENQFQFLIQLINLDTLDLDIHYSIIDLNNAFLFYLFYQFSTLYQLYIRIGQHVIVIKMIGKKNVEMIIFLN